MLRVAQLPILMTLAMTSVAYAGEPITMTRLDAMNAFNALSSIGEYTAVAKQGGQDVAAKKYLDVALPVSGGDLYFGGPLTGTAPVASLCLDSGNRVVKKTTTGPCI